MRKFAARVGADSTWCRSSLPMNDLERVAPRAARMSSFVYDRIGRPTAKSTTSRSADAELPICFALIVSRSVGFDRSERRPGQRREPTHYPARCAQPTADECAAPHRRSGACRAGQPDFDAVTLLGRGSITKASQVQMKPECVIELVHQIQPECPDDWADTLDRNRLECGIRHAFAERVGTC